MRFWLLTAMFCLMASHTWSQTATFHADATTWNDIRSNLEGRQQQSPIIVDQFYLDGMENAATLRLQPMQVWASDAKIHVHRPHGLDVLAAPNHMYFRGYIEGMPLSRVTLSIMETGKVRGVIFDEGQVWMVEGAADQPIVNTASRQATLAELGEHNAFNCSADGLPGSTVLDDTLPIVNEEIHTLDFERNRLGAPTYTATIAFETDNEFFNKFGNASDTTDYIGDLMAYISTVYSDEIDTALAVGDVVLYDGVTDPWTESGTRCTLFEFGKYWNDNNTGIDRTAAHFLSGRNFGGGIAWVGVLCRGPFNTNTANSGCSFSDVNNYGGDYGVSADLDANFNINNPTVVWDFVVVAHEIGHNFDSPHTHCYNGVGGNSEPVDECYNGESVNGCYAGSQGLPCGQSGAGCGTIMSYCHLLGGGLSNISPTFGLGHPHGVAPERVPTRMNAHVVEESSFDPTCIPQGCAEPAITAQPSAATVCVGSPFTLTVQATGTAPNYQWRLDGQNINGATNSSYTVNEASLADGGSYDVVITNDCGSVTSNAVTINVETGASITSQPASVERCLGETATFSVSVSGSVTGYQWYLNQSPVSGATSASLVINPVEQNDAGGYYCEITTTECGVITSNEATLTIGSGANIISQPQSQDVCSGDLVSLSVSASGAGITYQWRKNGVNISGANQSTYTMVGVDAGDAGNYDCLVGSTSCSDVATNTAVVTVTDSPNITSQPQDMSACVGAEVNFSISVSGSNFSYQWQKNGQNIVGASSATYTIASATLSDSGNFTCVINSDCGMVTSETASLSVVDGLAIIQGPTQLSRCEGESAIFEVVADGSNLSYQWRKNGSNIQGANSATYAINSVSPSDEAGYDCVVTSDCGSITTPAGGLEVDPLPVIASQPQSANLCSNQSLLLSVSTSGLGSVSYQWLKNGQEINGATNANYQILSTQPSDSGVYSCRVGNACGTRLSNPASVTVSDEAQVVLDQQVVPQTGSAVTLGFSFQGCELEGANWEWRNAQSQQVYGSNTSTVTLPLLAQTTVVELVVTADGGSFSVTETATVLVTTETDYNDPNNDGCYDGDDIAAMGQYWRGTTPDADNNNIVDVRDYVYIDTSGNCPGAPRSAKLGLNR